MSLKIKASLHCFIKCLISNSDSRLDWDFISFLLPSWGCRIVWSCFDVHWFCAVLCFALFFPWDLHFFIMQVFKWVLSKPQGWYLTISACQRKNSNIMNIIETAWHGPEAATAGAHCVMSKTGLRNLQCFVISLPVESGCCYCCWVSATLLLVL